MAIDLKPGDTIRRSELNARYGGRRYGGISPSRQSDNVFLFTDQERGAVHGYIYDGFNPEDGLYHYTGEGQEDDQRMIQGNRAVRDHAAEERELHLFDSSDGIATYLGQFEYVDDRQEDAHQTKKVGERKVIVFRLRRLTGDSPLAIAPIDQLPKERVKVIPVEEHQTERMLVSRSSEPYEAVRREQPLVHALRDFLRAQGHEVDRLYLRPDEHGRPILCDLYDATTNTVIEAKSSVAREAIRMAIGQLADYARLVEPTPRRLILVPEQPRPDLLELAAHEGIDVTWPDANGGFRTATAAGSGG